MPWFPKSPYERSRINLDLNLDLKNYVTQKELNEATGIDISGLTQRTDFDKLNVDVKKLQDAPHTTDDDTKKELQDLKTQLTANKTKLETDIKSVNDVIKKL